MLRIKDIIERLDEDIILKSVLCEENQRIRGVKLLTDRITVFDSDILYIGRYESMINVSGGHYPMNVMIPENPSFPEHPDIEKPDCHINIVYIKPDLTAEELLNYVTDILVDQYSLIERPAALFHTIIQGRGLPYIIEIASELLGNPVMLGDNNHRLLAASDFKEVDDLPWMEYRNMGFTTYEYTQKYNFKQWIEKTAQSRKAVIGSLGEGYKYKRIFCVIGLEQRIIGHLAVLEYNRSFTDKDLEITEFICDVIADEMKNSQNSGYQYNWLANRFISDLIQGSLTEPELIADRAKRLKWRLPDSKYLIVIQYNHYSETFGLISFIRESELFKSSGGELTFHDNNLIFITGCKQSQYITNQDIEPLSHYLKQMHMIAGVSQFFDEIMEIPVAYQQSLAAIRLGKKDDSVLPVYRYEDYGIYDMLEQIKEQKNLIRYCHPDILKLKEYDRNHKTDYLKSLYTYIVNMGNLAASADELYIHRNTMNYRLAKIQELISVDLYNRDCYMALYFSYKILEYISR
ncbi:helix-turn-helix domain-containing protein [Lacrimispora sp.]|uniref:PucR family transcriptional regulator n=1 Tax=Lacrimispora sp. TaxID=2719234 RepID=UPI0029E70F71|nr:PucR family transcriptional regulator, proline-responsive transcriptional activator [Lacrimispora sp.]